MGMLSFLSRKSGVSMTHLDGTYTVRHPRAKPVVEHGAPRDRAEVGCRETRAQVGRCETRAEVGRRETRVQVGRRETRAQVGRRETRAQVGRRETRVQVGRRETRAEVGRRETRVQVGRRETRAQVGRREIRVQCEMVGSACVKCSLSGELCFRLLFSNEPVFNKWQNTQYQASLNQWALLAWQGNAFRFGVCHFAAGPSLKVNCRNFAPVNDDQITVWAKSQTGWWAEKTPALGLDPDWRPKSEALRQYVNKCVQHCLAEAGRNGLLTAIALYAPEHSPLLHCALRLWTANRLLVKGWQASVGLPVASLDSPLVNTVPAPRVVQHQLDRLLELYICQLERQLLPMLQTTMVADDATKRKDAFFATLVLLNTLERDTWRLTYWMKHTVEVRQLLYAWSVFAQLMVLNFYVANLLLWELSNCLRDVMEASQAFLQGKITAETI
ncbi:hypothetical protein N0V88_007365 [Collariella sp. IMI 366227]|nr:hypothetical protein N0V88_007365 [Collariella sp. IMI 366227]